MLPEDLPAEGGLCELPAAVSWGVDPAVCVIEVELTVLVRQLEPVRGACAQLCACSRELAMAKKERKKPMTGRAVSARGLLTEMAQAVRAPDCPWRDVTRLVLEVAPCR